MSEYSILFVDDEENVLRSLKRLLRKEPYNILIATSGEEALALLEKSTIHLVVSDQRMPSMSGTELLQKVKERWPDTVRVILSGYADMSVIVDSINQGEVYRLLAKPWNDEELKMAIKQCLEQYEIRIENKWLVEQTNRQNKELILLNGKLEELVADRTRTLRLSQEILEEFPVAIIGISIEKEIILTNDLANEEFLASKHVMPGTDIEEVLPSEVIPFIENCIDGLLDSETFIIDWENKKVEANVWRLGREKKRGCIITLKNIAL